MRTLISCICPVTFFCYCRQFNNRLRLDTFLAVTANKTFLGGFLHETTFCACLSVFLPLNLWRQFFFVRSFYVLSLSLQFILSHCKPWWTSFFLRDCCLNDSPCQRCKLSLSAETDRVLRPRDWFRDLFIYLFQTWKKITISANLLFRLKTRDFIFGCMGGGGQQLERDWIWIPNFRPPAGKLIILNY